ncbi:MAG: hypothetical protein V4507_15545 [Verrucomicrobiota bacterium]
MKTTAVLLVLGGVTFILYFILGSPLHYDGDYSVNGSLIDGTVSEDFLLVVLGIALLNLGSLLYHFMGKKQVRNVLP